MNLTEKLEERQGRTKLWAKGFNPTLPDDKEWKQKIPRRHSDFHIFECRDCNKNFLKKTTCKNFLWVKRLCPECKEARRLAILANLRAKSRVKLSTG